MKLQPLEPPYNLVPTVPVGTSSPALCAALGVVTCVGTEDLDALLQLERELIAL